VLGAGERVGQDRRVPGRPYVLLSAAMSVDACIDDASRDRLVLSDDADLDRVDEVRAGVDAILVGAGTIRRDDPRLLVRSAQRRAERVAAGRGGTPLKVTLTGTGELDPGSRFFTTGDAEKLVYAPGAAAGRARARVGAVATVVDAGIPLDLHRVLADLRGRGVERLMVEGGSAVHTLFLTAGVVDEIQLAVAPFFVGDAGAPRFVGSGRFPHDADHRMRLAEARAVGDLVLLRYLLGGTDG
jgi:5-amino-6-(5-phosphoribosylamino)uracil reductase